MSHLFSPTKRLHWVWALPVVGLVALAQGQTLSGTQPAPPRLTEQRAKEAPWTWVLADGPGSETTHGDSQSTFDDYQENGIYVGRLARESELEAAPSGPAVFLGVHGTFQHPEWFRSIVGDADGGVSIGGVPFDRSRTGYYVRSADGSMVRLGGLSPEGLKDIKSVPTGRHAATVTFEGRVAFEGAYHGGKLRLTPARTLPALPTPDELEVELAGLADLSAAAKLSPVYAPGPQPALSARFQERLTELLREESVFFFGEEHWNVGVNQLFQDMLEWLMRERGVSTLFLEHSYSHTAHFRRYVSLGSDADAERFWNSSLRALVMAQSTRDLLDSVRVWNREQGAKPIAVCCLDAEFDYGRTLEDALGEYFRAADAKFQSELPAGAQDEDVLAEVTRLRGVLNRRAADSAEHPWMSRRFVENALINLEESVVARRRPTRMADRQGSMVRNITEFHGSRFTPEALESGLVVFKEGWAHAYKGVTRDDGAWWEAAYLEQRYPPTRGNVATLMAKPLGYDMDQASGVSTLTHKRWATQYHRFVDEYSWALRAGVLREGGIYRLGNTPLNGVGRVALRSAYQGAGRALLLESFSESHLRDANLDAGDGAWNRFDAVVYVIGSALEASLPVGR